MPAGEAREARGDAARLGYAAGAHASAGRRRDAPSIPPRRGTGAPACSFAQEQFWFVDQLSPGNAAFNFSWPLRLRGRLDRAALQRAVEEVVRRHEALRTRLRLEDGRLVQAIDAPEDFRLRIDDLTASPEPETAARRLVDEETRRPFDLGAETLFRASLLQLGDEDHILQFVVHHAVFDEWSKIVLYRELGALYSAFSAGRSSPLAEPGVQYGDYAEWERESLTEDSLADLLSFWSDELERAPAALELPTDRPRAQVARGNGARRRLALPSELTTALEELTAAEGTTLFSGLLAAFDVLLGRYTHERDLVVGVPVENRGNPGLDEAVGVFLNTLVVRNDLSGNPSFRALLRRTHERLERVAGHADLPFERLVRELQPVRDLSRHPVFQVLLAVNPPDPVLDLHGIEVEEIEPEITTARVDLFLFLQERAGGYDALWEYDTDLFDGETVEQMHGHFVALLAGAVADPERPIDELPMLAENESRRLQVEWNATDTDLPLQPLHELVEAQVERTPDATAAAYEGSGLTYSELNARANRLARRLRSLGVDRGAFVAVRLERSLELVVALLATLKSGGAFVPLDPELPPERLGFLLEDSGAQVLLTHGALLPDLPSYSGTVVEVDREETGGDEANLGVPVEAGDIAYVIYTSGSTGKPKGVLNTHRGIANRLLSMQDTYRMSASDRLLVKTPSSFDVSVREVFWPLLFGARLVLAAPGGHRDPAYLAEVIEREQITNVHFVPSMLQVFVEQADPARTRSVRCVLSGGEALPTELARRFLARFDCELHNLYGPTEAAVSVTSWQCDGSEEGSVVPIGRPVANTQLYVADERLEPVPVGVWGELLIGGVQVAAGYHGRPELTAAAFVPNPFGPGRLYRTGDLARRRRDGALEFGGRIDRQVKLRGFRVELGEIEAVLGGHEAVAECAVVLVGDSELAAYVVSRQPLDERELQAFLRARLPEYMVPASVTAIEALPLLPSGKLDRGALPAPHRPEAADAYVEPATETERSLSAIWSELLEVPRVGRNDNFFALGGHSLLAARLLGRLRKELEIELPLCTFLLEPTVAALAGAAAAEPEPAAGPELPPLTARKGVRECSFAQERFWFVDQVMGQGAAYNIPVSVRLRGELDVSVLERALSEIVRRHEILRTRFAADGERPVQIVEPFRPVTIPVADVSEQPAEAERLIAAETQARFDPTRAPLFGALLLKLGPADHILHLTFCHLVFDGWSQVVLYRELGALYDAFAAGGGSPLSELAIQYSDFAEWQREWLQGDLLEGELAYWRQALRGAPAALELPTDRPRPPVTSMRGAWSRSTIPASTVAGLQAVARQEGVTLYMTLLAAFDALLHRYSGQDDIVLGVPMDGRDGADLEHFIGPFVNTVVVRADLSGEPTFRELLERVRERTVEAVAHQRLPFEHLVRELQPDRDLGRHPLYQVMLTLVPAEGGLQLSGLEVEELVTERPTAPIDLTVFLYQRGAEVEAVWEYSTDLFERESVERMQAHFLHLLEAVVEAPESRIGELPLLDDAEPAPTHEPSRRAYPVACLHELFQARAAERPDAPAVTFEGESLSYRELNERANRLAHRLRELGVGPEVPVALCLERSFDLVSAVLGVLKAGGAYVPLDPDYPADRLSFALSDTAAPVLVTQEHLRSRLPEHGAALVCIDSEPLDDYSSDDPEPAGAPDNMAYVIYTSGSTGRPKGVQVEHRHVARLFSATDEWFGFGPEDTWVLLHSYAFDFSVWELFGALLHGGRLVISPLWTTRAPDALAALLAEERVTVLNATPSLFVSARDALVRVADDLSLRVVVFGGEALQPATLRPWFERFGSDRPRLVNMYGITETTVHVTYRPVTAADCDRDASPIGGPIPDLELFVLDGNLNHVPAGVPGELFVGGAGVARGYLNRPELTAERFLPNPFGEGCLYRTGDRVRLVGDELEFLGRIDDQVKIRGFRIELGEVQAVLAEHPAVGEAAVVAFDAAPGDTRLAAYVVPAAETAGAVRTQLRLQSKGRIEPGQLVELAGGLSVVARDAYQAEMLQERIFGRRAYLQHGIEVPADGCVLDLGANGGLFSILVRQLAPRARLLAFEQRRELEAALRLNAEIYGFEAPAGALPPLGALLDAYGIERVDLLKVSLDGRDALAGADWSRIAQAVLELPAGDEVAELTELLRAQGFAVAVEKDAVLGDWGPSIVFARRENVSPAVSPARAAWHGAERLRADLRAHLEERLPGFMVPSSLTLLHELPLTSNGKLDRKSLPPPSLEEHAASAFLAPRTETEERIAEVWREILGVDRVGVDDNFFHLGGHSLMAARVVTQVRERLSVDLSVRSLFEHPTLGTFAEHVSGAQHSETVAPVAPTVAQRRYPASFSQQQLFFLDRLRPGMATYNSALAVRVKGELDVDALERSLADVIARHEALRTVLVEGADGPEQVVLDRWEFSVPRVDLTPFPDDVREDELRRRLRETRRPFDLGRDLMLRATLFELGPDERVIAFLAHHVAFDGWSADVFLRDLAELYEARREGRPPSLPELPFQYGDFARQQRDRLRGERLERELDYWRTELGGAPTILPLPSDRPRPARETYDGASLLLSIPGELAGEARRLCQAEGVTPYMLMLAAFGTLLYRATGQDDVLVSGPFANRDRAEFDRLVGFFANTVVTRVRHGGNPSFSTLLGRVRQTVLGAFDHQEVPLDHVVEALAPERRAGFNPLVQVNFRVLAEPPPTLRLRGAATSNVPVEIGLTHFDLALEVHVLAEEISAEFIYKTDLFDHESIARMAADFEALLRQAVARPDTRLLALELPSEQAVPAPAVASPGGIRGFRSSAP